MSLIESLPTFTNSATLEQYRAAFDSVQCVCFKQVDNNTSDSTAIKSDSVTDSSINTGGNRKKRKHEHEQESVSVSPTGGESSSSDRRTSLSAAAAMHNNKGKAVAFHQKSILHTIHSATSKDQESWTIENDILDSSTSASDFLSPTAKQNGYCSFVLQDDSNQAVSNFTEQYVRHPSLPLSAHDESQKQQIVDTVCIAKPYWLFVGRNNNAHEMKGRNEHTDDIYHNGGTFHYQLAGVKTWNIRPTEELREMCDERDIALKDTYVHTVEEGDIFVINTRLWWHQTEIPGAISAKTGGNQNDNLSISYARDIHLDGTQPTEGDEQHMNSKDGAWATAFIAKGTVLLTEVDPPISRTTVRADANCEMFVVEDSEEGEKQLAVVAFRDIKEGEFYTILESKNEEQDD
eukprot:scaffold68169_cov58-Attheya_sp.AAC.3